MGFHRVSWYFTGYHAGCLTRFHRCLVYIDLYLSVSNYTELDSLALLSFCKNRPVLIRELQAVVAEAFSSDLYEVGCLGMLALGSLQNQRLLAGTRLRRTELSR